ncbi:MAG: hypothetical protein ACOCSD_05130 [Halolamina sp.]
MPAAGALFALLIVLTIAGTIGLWYVIDRETEDAPRMSRTDAERAVRQDVSDADRGEDEQDRSDEDDATDRWGTDAEWGVDGDR